MKLSALILMILGGIACGDDSKNTANTNNNAANNHTYERQHES